MKKLALLCLVLLTTAGQHFTAFAHRVETGDDDEIVIILHNIENPLPGFRGPGSIPLTATYNTTYMFVTVCFLSSLGVFDITLTNLTTGGTDTMQINSNFGGAVIPVNLGSGNYRIDFSSSGGNYYGTFVVY